jgi:hypothetical protein
MGECAFGRGFGSVAPDTKPEPGFSDQAWQKIPDAIVTGLSRRYAVSIVAVSASIWVPDKVLLDGFCQAFLP